MAANVLADAGWEVTVCEASDTPGGAVSSDFLAPGFVTDRFSAFYPLAAASPVIESLGLEDFGLAWRHAPSVLAHPFSDGSCAVLERDPEITADSLDALGSRSGELWRSWYSLWGEVGEELLDALMSPFPPLRAGARLLRAARRPGWAQSVRFALASVDSENTEDHPAPATSLLAGCALHSDVALDDVGSAGIGWLLAMLGHARGWPVPKGGAQSLTDALVSRLARRGGTVLCSTEVTEVVLRFGRAAAVRTSGGETISARRAILADVSPMSLYLGLLANQELPESVWESCRSFRPDFPVFKVDWALRDKIPWRSPRVADAGTVHLGGSYSEMLQDRGRLGAGIVSAEPFLIVGQMTTADPTRSPPGTESAWAYGHLPHSVLGDAAGAGIVGNWDRGELELLADRAQARLESFAPAFGSAVLARRVIGPKELELANANLVKGGLGGGTMALYNQGFLRPTPSWGRPETPIEGLFLASSFAHPGPGVHGACGANAARAALAHSGRMQHLFLRQALRSWEHLSGPRKAQGPRPKRGPTPF